MNSSDRAANLRLFVALEIPAEWRAVLTTVQHRQERLVPGYFRWVNPALMHLTLVFLGNQPPAIVATVADLLRRAAADVPQFELSLDRLGTFPAHRAPRVLWAGLRLPHDPLLTLRGRLAAGLQQAGIAFDDRPLAPHITLGRARRPGHQQPAMVRDFRPPAPYAVERLVLFESRLVPAAPTYHELASAALLSRED